MRSVVDDLLLGKSQTPAGDFPYYKEKRDKTYDLINNDLWFDKMVFTLQFKQWLMTT